MPQFRRRAFRAAPARGLEAQAVRRWRATAGGGRPDAGLPPKSGGRDPIVGVVGALQFDVIQSRLQTEYGAASRVEPLSYVTARWLDPPETDGRSLAGLGADVLEVADRRGRTVLLFPSAWALQYAERENPRVTFLAMHLRNVVIW